jgi:RNA polymerase sigma factor (sigma-70 family)
MSDRGDGDLVRLARDGDRGAFGELIGRHEPAVRRIAGRVVGDWAEAEDVVQDSLLRAYLGLADLRDPASFGAWLRGIAVNVARMRARARRRAARVPAAGPAGDGGRPDEEVAAREAFRAVCEELAELLPPSQGAVVLLHDVAGLTTAEIAASLDLSPGAVRVRLHRGRARLRPRLAPPGAAAAAHSGKEPVMPECVVDQVLVLLQDDAGAPLPADVAATRVIVLRERDGARVVPIWVGAPEGDALALQLAGDVPARPLTPDLTARLLDAAGAAVERVAIAALRENTFYAAVTVRAGGRREEVDARPSDALNLAARVGAPVHVAAELLDEAAFAVAPGGDVGDALAAEIERRIARAAAETGEPQPSPPAGAAWRALTPELVRELAARGTAPPR